MKSQRVQRGCRRGIKNILTSSPHLVRAKIREWRCQLVHKEGKRVAFSGVEPDFLRPLEMELSRIGASRENQRNSRQTHIRRHHKDVIFMIANSRI